MTKFQTLLSSGLPINWTTLLVGWQEGYATTAEVQAYASDQLAGCSEAETDRVFRL